jgi:hypothetical protein
MRPGCQIGPHARRDSEPPSACEDRLVRVGTPLGEYPFEFRRVERRRQSVAIVGIVAGLESSVIVDKEDVGLLVRRVALPIGAVALFLAYRRSR